MGTTPQTSPNDLPDLVATVTADTLSATDDGLDAPAALPDAGHDQPEQAGADVVDAGTPGGEGVRESGPGGSIHMHSDGESFVPKVTPEKKSRRAAPREAAEAAFSPAAPVSAPAQGDAAAEDEDAPASVPGPVLALRVWKLCPNPRLVFAKADLLDAAEVAKRVVQRRHGALRRGQLIRATPHGDMAGLWRQLP